MNNARLKRPAQQYGMALVITGDVLLFVLLVVARMGRIRGSQTPLITAEFIGLLAAALIVVSISAWIVASGRYRHIFGTGRRSAGLLALWAVVDYAILAGVSGIITLHSYMAPFAVWLTFLHLGGVLLVYAHNLPDAPGAANGHLSTGLSLALVLAAVIVSLAAVEVTLRVYFGLLGDSAERARYVLTGEQIANEQSLVEGMPYINFGLSPHNPESNSRGFRGPEIAVPKPDGVYRIVALGGSTTYGTGLDQQDTYPFQLQKILREEYGYTNVEVVNGGVMTYSTWDTLANFEYHVLDIQPDMILVYHAINDVVARLVDPAYYNGLNPARGIWNPAQYQVSPFALYRFLMVNINPGYDPINIQNALTASTTIARCSQDACAPSLQMTPMEVLEANPPIYSERNLRNLVAAARANSVAVVFSSWAYFPDAVNGHQIMTTAVMQRGVAEQNAITARLATELDVPYYDLEANLPYNPDFWVEGVHMTPSGSHEQAEEYAAFLVNNHLIPEPAGGG